MTIYDIKWKNDLRMYMPIFNSFVLEGNINDFQPIENVGAVRYDSLQAAIAHEYAKDYCVVFYDHTKQPGKAIDGGKQGGNNPQDVDENWFKSFKFFTSTSISSSGEGIPSPNIELFKEYYTKKYLDGVNELSTKDMQGGKTIDVYRLVDVMTDFSQKQKEEKYAELKPFMFILPDVSRFMTTPGNPRNDEAPILKLLFKATQLADSPCKILMFVDKMNDFPTWFESENTNSAIKKIFIPMPDIKMRETFFEVELQNDITSVGNKELEFKKSRFAAYTDKFSLRRLLQFKTFVLKGKDENKKIATIEHLDKTVFQFESGQTKNPWQDKDLRDRVAEMAKNIKKELKGQDNAIDRVAQTFKAVVAGLSSSKKNDRRPRAVFFLAGPTGTGKTELTKKVAEEIFKKEDSMIRFDMSEFRGEFSDSRLFGAPPGYVGYESGGELTKAVKQNPFTIILFDEIEKASDKIWDKFLQILGDGRLTDGKGDTVSFTQSVIVFTSNLGITADPVAETQKSLQESAKRKNLEAIKRKEDEINKASTSEDRKNLADELKKLYFERSHCAGLTCDIANDFLFKECWADLDAVSALDAFNKFVSQCVEDRIKEYFDGIGRREVLGRIGDNVLVFNFIDENGAKAIAEKEIEKFKAYLKEEHERELDLNIEESAKEYIISQINKPEVLNFGGRSVVDKVSALFKSSVGEFLFDKNNDNVQTATLYYDEFMECLICAKRN